MSILSALLARPLVGIVVSVLLVLAGTLAFFQLPISQYPSVVPPSIIVHAEYPGANPTVLAESVAVPLEEAINGVQGMLYSESKSNLDGKVDISVFFGLDTNPDLDQVLVQNRVTQATARLPSDVQRLGVTTTKSSPTLTLLVNLISPTHKYDARYMRNYAEIHLRDELERIKGVGEVQMWGGSGDYGMRIWLDPYKVAARHLDAADIASAIRDQNAPVAVGSFGAEPGIDTVAMNVLATAKGRLSTPEEFGQIVLKASASGQIVRLTDVARIELGADTYGFHGILDNDPTIALVFYTAPGTNVLDMSAKVYSVMQAAKLGFPPGLDYRIYYDPTRFVRASIMAVARALLESIALVVCVVLVFLKTWRASIIPLCAVPVSVIGTFAGLYVLGFSINSLSLFGIVLAIGIVVDDAIVVVENIQRNMEDGLPVQSATLAAMLEVSGPILAIGLTLVVVFVPLAFMDGLTGRFFRQFAVTISIATTVSAINSLTLSPVLASMLMHERKVGEEPSGALRRAGLRANRRMAKTAARLVAIYLALVKWMILRRTVALTLYFCLIGGAIVLFRIVPTGFVPVQDQLYLLAAVELPRGATIERTEEIVRQMNIIALREPGVDHVVSWPGVSVNGFTFSPSSGLVTPILKPFAQRRSARLGANAIARSLSMKYARLVPGAAVAVFQPPPVQGIGTVGGFKLEIEETEGTDYVALYRTMSRFVTDLAKRPEIGPDTFSSYNVNTPQIRLDVDRTRAKELGLSMQDVFSTIQSYVGSTYINDFNAFGRVYQVRMQADGAFRAHPEDLLKLKVRNQSGDMVPLGSLIALSQTYGPQLVGRYNNHNAADVNGGPAPGYSSGQAETAVEQIASATLPHGTKFEWTDLVFQEKTAGNAAILVFPVSIILVYLVLAAFYNSLTLPAAVILIVPTVILPALVGVWMTGTDNNVFTKIGFVVLIGLASKNSILIVHFANQLEKQGVPVLEAAMNAARLRLRPILMTSIAFMAGVVPLVLSTGAGAEMRHAIGIVVFFGMLGVTIFGLLLTPMFYVALRVPLSGAKNMDPVREAAAIGRRRLLQQPR